MSEVFADQLVADGTLLALYRHAGERTRRGYEVESTMTLRKKTAVLMGVTLLGLIGALAATFQVFYLDRFRKLQEQDALESATRAIGALAEETARLASVNQDYANWDELYAFMQTRDEHFVATGLPNSATQVPARVDLLALLDADGRTVLGRAFDPRSGAATPLPGGVERLLTDGRLLASAEGKGVEGVLLAGELPLIVTTRSIQRSDRSGPSRGTLFMGSYLDSARIDELL
jgi:adenylate cyclase